MITVTVRLLPLLLLILLSGCSALQSRQPAAISRSACADFRVLQQAGAPDTLLPQNFHHDCTGVAASGHTLAASLQALQPDYPALQPDPRFRDVSALLHPPASAADDNQSSRYRRELTAYLQHDRYACRFPVYAGYFARRYRQETDFSACDASVPFYLLSMREGGQVRRINPQDISEIHLLFSSQGEALQSSFGHTALRLIVCPPGQRQKAACDRNLREHIVLGFMGRIDELQMNPFKGIFGGYDAHLLGFTFMEIYRTNTLYENRNLYSLPLRLSAAERQQIVRELAEVHWSYRGDYQFFTNNCATLLQDTLQQLISAYGSDQQLAGGYIRPDRFFAAVRHSALADSDVLENLPQAERDGYYFPSTLPYYRQALQQLNRQRSLAPVKQLDDYPQRSAEQRLLAVLRDPQLLAALQQDKHLRDAQRLLEEYVLLLQERQLGLMFARYLAGADTARLFQQAAARLQQQPAALAFMQTCYQQPLQQLLSRLPRSDGMPEPAFLQQYRSATDCSNEQQRSTIRQVFAGLMPDSQLATDSRRLAAEIRATLHNLDTLQ
ncbi:MAG: DUF4105 domain-containing protein [Pseudomonadota bacterium]|nr:DUF4105 domain-containing protein [Pseudomonadota bacterium]